MGRRIEDPLGGDTAAPPHLAQGIQGKDLCTLGVLGILGVLGMLGVLSVRRPLRRNEQNNFENLAKIVPEPSEIDPRGLQNRARSPPRRNF